MQTRTHELVVLPSGENAARRTVLKVLSQRQLEDAVRLATARKPGVASRTGAVAAATDIERILAALALRNRREIVDLLRTGSFTASQIAEAVGLHRANFSRHLNQLREAGVIDVTVSPDDARERIVSLRPEAFDALKVWVDSLIGGR